MTKKALLVAFHFPPLKVSSGLERTLALTRHLPAHDWSPLVLTASPMAYPAISDERMNQIPASTLVTRTMALDASRHLALWGRYPSWFALPDRWQTWILSAIPVGLSLIRRHKPKVIYSTYPIVSAHWIAYALHRISGIPWVADYRDPVAEQDERTQVLTPTWPVLRRARLACERASVQHASALTFCTTGAKKICADRYLDARLDRWRVIPNGYDEAAFSAAEKMLMPRTGRDAPVVLLHSGTIYPTLDRDPSHFLHALRQVLDQRPSGARPVQVIFRASGVESYYGPLVSFLGLSEQVIFLPAIPYEAALLEMMNSDGLILFQGYTSNPAIPAKLYEYFRARRPIFALTDKQGDTARLLQKEGVGVIAPLDHVSEIVSLLHRFLADIDAGVARLMVPDRVTHFERASGAFEFAKLFDQVSS